MKMGKQSLLFISFWVLIILTSCKNENANTRSEIIITDAIVYVNGYCITESSIDAVYDEFINTGISRDKIINDTILEVLVVQEAPKYSISISDDELDTIMNDFKSSDAIAYSKAVNLYGEEVLREKIKTRNLFSKTKSYVMENVILVDGITHSDIVRFANKYNLEEQLLQYSDQQIIQDLHKEIESFLFDEWMNTLKENASITFINTNERH